MPKFTPQLPLLEDKTQPGYVHIETLTDLVRQNLKMVMLTNPGERVMDPEFGVGLYGMLFENFHDRDMLLDYEGRISEQVAEYLPYIDLNAIAFDSVGNKIMLMVDYSVPELEFVDQITVQLSEE
jgi:phage baseplate assembly protein W